MEWISVYDRMPTKGVAVELKDRHEDTRRGFYDERSNTFKRPNMYHGVNGSLVEIPCVLWWRPLHQPSPKPQVKQTGDWWETSTL